MDPPGYYCGPPRVSTMVRISFIFITDTLFILSLEQGVSNLCHLTNVD